MTEYRMRGFTAAAPRFFLDGGSEGHLRVAVVATQIVKGDGISHAVRDTLRALSGVAEWDVSVFARHNEYPEIAFHRVRQREALARHPKFAEANIVIYHFGFHDPLFDVIPSGNGHGRQIAYFHNITPAEFLPDWVKPDVARSFQQLRHFRHADRLWPLTSTNAKVLLDAGMDPDRIEILPPVVEWPPAGVLAEKRELPVKILFVGRMIQSKGVLDLLDAARMVRTRCTTAFRLSLVGAPADIAYYEEVRQRVAASGGGDELLGHIENVELEKCYRSAHILVIPSYHEGFCRPVAEGLRAGCVPVGYASHHIPIVAKGLGRLVTPGDIGALADALQAVIEAVAPALASPDQAILPLDRGPTSVRLFDKLAKTHLRNFSYEKFSRAVVSRIRKVSGLPQPGPIKS
jgi:glycosyltransferase involved in cell wall biosynthesis